MKKFMLLALPALMAGCGPKEYHINGIVNEQLDSTSVYLFNDKNEKIDSCIVTNGTFTFTGLTEDQMVASVKMGPKRSVVFLENGRNITIDATGVHSSVTDEGGLNDKLSIFQEYVQKNNADIRALHTKMRNDSVPQHIINDTIKTIIRRIDDFCRTTITENKENTLGAYLFSLTVRQLYPTLEQVDSMCSLLKYANNYPTIQAYKEVLEQVEKTKEGKMYTDFRGFTIDGKLTKLSDYVGKGNYVLVDFWASWCQPCMREVPRLTKLHNSYKDKGLTVLGVNISDKHDSFKEALKTNKIEYPQMEIPTYAKENGAKIYNVKSIPHIMLIAPDGTILKRGLHGDEMVKYVEEILSTNK